jgi:hypothetical protein
MGGSLREQLLKAGLVDPRKAREAEVEKRKEGRQRRGAPPGRGEPPARPATDAKVERDRTLNREREEAARRKAVAAEVADLVRAHRLSREGSEVAFHFRVGGAIKQLYVTRAQQRQLAAGQVAIVRDGKGYALVTAEVAEKVRARDEASVALLNRPETPPAEAEDDPYARYKVPDDLMW